jgi:CRISPR system Cascade subunit CasB
MTPNPAQPRAEQGGASPREAALNAAKSLEKVSPGELSDLRRMRPSETPPAVFWKLMGAHLEPVLPSLGAARDEAECRWAAGLSAVARLIGSRGRANSTRSLHAPGQPLGRALASADFSELRFDRLLRARGVPLQEQVRQAAGYLAAKGEPANGVDLVLLVVNEDDERLRRDIARQFFYTRLTQENKRKDA